VIRFDYYGSIPGARARAAKRAARVAQALSARYPDQFARAEIHYIQVSRDLETREPPELLGSNLPSLIEEIGE
jgi:Carboxysome Shell Carbonic Anhydrase.